MTITSQRVLSGPRAYGTRYGGTFRLLPRRVAAAVVATALSIIGTFVGGGSVAGASGPSSEFYLSLGASVSVGVQPLHAFPKGRPTPHGFANDLVAIAASRGVTLKLTEMGCPGESTQTMIYGGDHCHAAGATQLDRAVAFLRAHSHDRGVVTLDIGFNDVRKCLSVAGADAGCVHNSGLVLTRQIEQIMTILKAAAGPKVTLVGTNLYDPFLASAVTGTGTRALATGSESAIVSMNAAIFNGYAATSTTVVDVAKAFSILDTTPVFDPTWGTVPTNVAQVCRLTWMCQPTPFGPNIHPDDRGYQVIAESIGDVLFP